MGVCKREHDGWQILRGIIILCRNTKPSTVEENLSITTIRCNLTNATHGENAFILTVN